MATEHFFSRWSQRKLAADQAQPREPEQAVTETSLTTHCDAKEDSSNDPSAIQSEHSAEVVTPVDNKDAEHTEPSIASLLTSEVSEELKKTALRKLFLSGEFSEVCMMDDYNADYSNTAKLSTTVAQGLRQWLHSDNSAEPSQDENTILTQADDDIPSTESSHELSQHNQPTSPTSEHIDSELESAQRSESETKHTA